MHRQLDELLERVQTGETVLITEGEMAVARLERIPRVNEEQLFTEPQNAWEPEKVLKLPIAKADGAPLTEVVMEERESGW